MNFIVKSDLVRESDFDITLIINALSPKCFLSFVERIAEKGDWYEDLCCCYFEFIDNIEYYRFETFEGNKFRLTYNEFLYYVKLAIIRYFLDWESNEDKKQLELIVKNSSFSSVLNEIDESYSTGIPLIYR